MTTQTVHTTHALITQINAPKYNMEDTLCPGCNLTPLDIENPAMDKLSRYGHGYICNSCGTKEAFLGDFISEKIEIDTESIEDVLEDEEF